MADITFGVKAHSETPTKTVVKARSFELVIDEPERLGGTDAGPNPIEYVLAAFSGCLNVMCHLIAKEMDFELRGLEIELSGTLNSDKLFGKETSDRAGYKEIRAEIKADSDADESTLAAWIKEVEQRCPVSDNLANPTPIHISLKQIKG